ncbi:tRNA pseudouridine(65) synthase TruC [Alkalimonas sp.]|uniref:tRNA pseudouridine(65) synthase TruC n=1 Tax=Alkalimonas sp. TaxID=1872453 RepID=UPI00263A699F|nr:tRNA pseudouridine(65) synthase TruC [Alkalimonas sp.]MCC5824893.1 tRNA pseudouridine(65) synthase TruC [Alkalimonas sp.]
MPASRLIETPDITELTILYQDEWLVAVDKPAGMLVHRSFLDKHESRFVMQTLRDQLGQHVFPVHRLDRPTSGVLLFALSSEIARLLSEQNASQHWHKGYLAIVRGYLVQGGTLDYPLKEQQDKIADKFSSSDKEAQAAVTDYLPLAQVELPIPVSRYPAARYSLVALSPRTGRKHQLRRHLAHLRHPIIGDTSHGDGKHNRLFREHLDCARLLLLAKQLILTHPISGTRLCIEASLTEWQPILQQLGWPEDESFYRQALATLYKEQA